MVIRDIECRWPGSTHDSFMLAQSYIGDKFEQGGFGNLWVLGDSGYPCKTYLMTPYLNPTTEGERRYNRAQKNARSIVERYYHCIFHRITSKLWF